MKNKEKSPNFIDIYVGNRTRLRRMELNMSQAALAEILGVSFQQVQKYEKGTNRISAGNLKLISEALGVSVAFFYENCPTSIADQETMKDSAFHLSKLYSNREVEQLFHSFSQILMVEIRKEITNLTITMEKNGKMEKIVQNNKH